MQSTNLILLTDQMALSRSLDVIANNVANASTTGFKREGITFDTYLGKNGGSQKPLKFVVDKNTYRDMSNGPIEPTGNSLDLAIQGKGFFQVQLPDGSTGYTRGGAFTLDNQGRIVTQSGYPVLNDGGQAVTLPDTTSQINVSGDGFISARTDNGKALAELGKLQLVKVDNEQDMQSTGGGIYTTKQVATPTTEGSVVQGAIEQSNVKPVAEMTSMIQIMRSYEQITNMISMENQRHSTALDKLSQTTA